MWNWIKRKLGIFALEAQQERASKAIKRIEGKLGVGAAHQSQRYDEIERARARRNKDHLRGVGKKRAG